MINKEFFEQILGRLKIFWTAMILVFFVVSLQYLGLHTPNMLAIISTKFQTMFPSSQQSLPTPPMNTQATTNIKGGE